MIAKANTFSRTVDLIGSAICAGILEEGRVFTVQQLVDLTGASRSIVREATQVRAATDPPLSRATLHPTAPSSAHPETRPSAISPRSSRPPSGIESGGSRGGGQLRSCGRRSPRRFGAAHREATPGSRRTSDARGRESHHTVTLRCRTSLRRRPRPRCRGSASGTPVEAGCCGDIQVSPVRQEDLHGLAPEVHTRSAASILNPSDTPSPTGRAKNRPLVTVPLTTSESKAQICGSRAPVSGTYSVLSSVENVRPFGAPTSATRSGDGSSSAVRNWLSIAPGRSSSNARSMPTLLIHRA